MSLFPQVSREARVDAPNRYSGYSVSRQPRALAPKLLIVGIFSVYASAIWLWAFSAVWPGAVLGAFGVSLLIVRFLITRGAVRIYTKPTSSW